MTSPEDGVSVATEAGPLTAATCGASRGEGKRSSLNRSHLCLLGRTEEGTRQSRGGEPAACGDAEYVESQRAGGQSVSTEAQVEPLNTEELGELGG